MYYLLFIKVTYDDVSSAVGFFHPQELKFFLIFYFVSFLCYHHFFSSSPWNYTTPQRVSST